MIAIRDAKLFLDGKLIDLEYPILDAHEYDDLIVVLFDPDANIRKWGQFHNLIALSKNGERLWEAERPTTETGDSYYAVTSWTPLVALSLRSYECEIDPKTGVIIKWLFYK